MGLFATIAWATYFGILELQRFNWKSIFHIIFIGLLCIASFYFAYGLTNLYNYSVGGGAIAIKEFLFPLLTPSYMNEILTTSLPGIFSSWVFIVAIFLAFFAKGLYSTNLCTRQSEYNYKAASYGAFAILGMGSLTYAINRTAYGNFAIVYELVILLLCIISEKALIESNKIFDKNTCVNLSIVECTCTVIRCISMCVVILLSAATVTNYSHISSLGKMHKDETEMRSLLDNIDSVVPPDTKATGIGGLEVYAALGRNTGIYSMDYSDLAIDIKFIEYFDLILKELDDEALFVSETQMAVFKESITFEQEWNGYKHFISTHKIKKAWCDPFSEGTYQYWVPINK